MSFILFLFLPIFASAAVLGQKKDFFVNPDYDWFGRQEIRASLQRIGPETYFYIDDKWLEELNEKQKKEVKTAIQDLDYEFNNRIYPILTNAFGSEWNPGIDKNPRIFVLIHPMKKQAGGYFRDNDEYPKLQIPDSNEMEMVYLNAFHIQETIAKSFLAHEFTHLITFNQKNRIHKVSEDIWLNEARAEYAPSLCGYNSEYKGSNLENRVEIFLKNSSDSITEWQNKQADYGGLNVFIQYLVEHYGKKILTDSLKIKETGIKSLNKILKENNYEQDFSQIFTDWTIAVLVNNCEIGGQYCYQNKNLKKIKIMPHINFLPLTGKSNLGVNQTTENWAGNWYRFIGGQGGLKVKFIGSPENIFSVPYLTQDILGEYSLGFFQLDQYQRGEIVIPDFGKKIKSLTIIPSAQGKTAKFSDAKQLFPFFWEVSTMSEEKKIEPLSKFLEKPISEMNKQEIISKIDEIEKILEQLKSQYNKLFNLTEIKPEIKPEQTETEAENKIICQKFENNLYFGITGDDVKCLQKILKKEGDEIYPEAIITGFFGPLTKSAVIRFQEKYAKEILTQWGLTKGTGFIGKTTRAKLNKLITDQ